MVIGTGVSRGGGEPPRVTLRRGVCTAAAGASTEEEFFARLAQAGVLVRRRHSTINPLEVTGYAVGLPHHMAKDGQIIWYGGGKLAADLTLPKLRARWDSPPGGDRLAAASALRAPAARAVLRATVATEAEQARSETEFFTRLRAAGVLVRERFSTINPGEVTGYAAALPGAPDQLGRPGWYSGGRLHDSLTLPRLRSAWVEDQPQALGRSGAFRFTAPECAEIYRHAASQAAVAAEHLRHCAANDPQSGADAAWAAADTLHAAARATGNRVLRCTADHYDRAARAPHRQIPRRTHDGDRLRTAARLLAMTSGGSQGIAHVGALAENLVALVDAVAGLRQAHAAQAAAARKAAEQLQAAFTQARGPIPHPGQAGLRRAEPHSAVGGRAQADFPMPLAAVLSATAAGETSPGSRARPRVGQPPRARPTR